MWHKTRLFRGSPFAKTHLLPAPPDAGPFVHPTKPDDDDSVAAVERRSSAAPGTRLLVLCREMEGSAAGRRWWRACGVWLWWPVGRSVRSEAGICQTGQASDCFFFTCRSAAVPGQGSIDDDAPPSLAGLRPVVRCSPISGGS